MTKSHQSDNKVEISDTDYNEGILEIRKANRILNRYGIEKYMNLLARNWAQVKYSEEVFAVGSIIKSGEKDSKGYKNMSSYDIVSGGTGYATTMTILHSKPLYVFEQSHDSDELLRKIVNALQKYKSDFYQKSIDHFVNTYLREQREINLNKLDI